LLLSITDFLTCGPAVLVAEPTDAQHGPLHIADAALFGAPNVERLPTAVAMTANIRRSRRVQAAAAAAIQDPSPRGGARQARRRTIRCP
jgi:hypothetical protein